jgi:hypothetical protein
MPLKLSLRSVAWSDPDWDLIFYCHACGAWAPHTHKHEEQTNDLPSVSA